MKKDYSSDPLYLLIIISQSGNYSNSPKFGLIFLVSIYKESVFPIPFVPTNPRIAPFRGTGNLCKTNQLKPNLCETYSGKSIGKLIILIALKGHFLTQRLQPMHSISLIKAKGSSFSTLMQILPWALMGQIFLHSRLHFFGLHFSSFKIANHFLSFAIIFIININLIN